MNNFYQQTHLTSKFTQLVLITCMLKPEDRPLWTELFKEINKENRWDIRWYYRLTKNSFVIKLCNSFSSRCVGLTFFEPMENLMFVMSMDGLLSKETQNIGMIVPLFSRKRFWTSFFREEITVYLLKGRAKQKNNSSLADQYQIQRWNNWDR